MGETMREYLERRRHRNLRILGILFAAMLAPIAVYLLAPYVPAPYEWVNGHGELVGGWALLLFLVAQVFRSFVVSYAKCPKCERELRRGVRVPKTPASCPNCGVSFDEPMPQKPIS